MSVVSRPKPTIFFSPRAISGCAVWFDGMDINGNGTVPSNGSSVTTWNDKSGNGYNATVASGKVAATYSSSYNALNFATSSTGYETSYPANPTNETMFVVFNNASPSSGNNVIIGGQGGARGLGAGYSGSGGATLNVVGNLNNGIVWLARTSGGSYTSGTTAIVSSQFTSSSNSISLNGGTVSTGGAPGFSNATTTYLGVDTRTTAYYYVGYAMEIIFYNSVLSDSDKQKIEGYLAQKWGLTSSLPAGHPGLTQTFYGSLVNSTVFTPIVLIPYNLYTNYNPLTATGSTCILWLDASDPSTLYSDAAGTTLASVNGTVGYWRDKSSSGFNCTQTTLAYRPTYVAAAKNSRSILSFNGLTNFLNMPQFTAVPLTIFFVAQGTVFLQNTFFLSLGSAGDSIMMRMLNSPQFYGVDGNEVNKSYSIATTNADTNWHLWTLTVSSTTLTFYFDGTLVGTSSWSNGSGYTFATNTIASWNQQVGSKATTLRIPEILFYSAVLGTTQQQQVESYLNEKWALRIQPTRTIATIRSVPKFISVIATGGTITYATVSGIEYKIHSFTSVGTANFTLTSPASVITTVLVVAGGGAGGTDDGGGGGAGGVIYNPAFTITSGSYTVTVGNGGTSNGASGGNSVLSSLTAIGGGGGANSNGNGQNGGSGGGIGWAVNTPGSGTAGQGFAGGGGTSDPNFCAGGGGGAGGVGGTGSGITPGNGGIGVSHTIAGTTYNVGGGGGGGLAVQNSSGTNSTASFGGGNGAGRGANAAVAGTPNTGGGGGGANNMQAPNGAFGGSGIVIISYRWK